ncbi:hypothetical protein HKBW3S43_00982 [Candidatus Hakubella thermalkaliphila]|uniref:Uncharacterized protein n=1 Tax=Candidatus Hakubella thermalkaliphila TaxID=2754717 RepID=A0A6V8PSU9_9ACTN|nr:hypothetical protein [Candidatus Hakubella thermalkaliphila]GFP35190.1 hypothetical protein HKBW3S43_00982 [Candidatus Hakubella thermalkaliphila]
MHIHHREKAIKNFIEYVNQANGDICLDLKEKHRLRDKEAGELIKNHGKSEKEKDLTKLEKHTRDKNSK